MTQVVGYCHAPAQSYQPPPQLQQFLETGPPPVYFGFGSMPVNQPEVTLLSCMQCTRCLWASAGGMGKHPQMWGMTWRPLNRVWLCCAAGAASHLRRRGPHGAARAPAGRWGL
jgi:hypothetical protein